MRFAILFLLFSLTTITAAAQQPPSSKDKLPLTQDPRFKEAYEKHKWGEGKLKVGDLAPDFELKKLGSEERVQLSSFADKKPVALIFGSYTCPRFRGRVPSLKELPRMFRGKVELLLIYISEAHPTDGSQDEENMKDGILLPSPRNMGEKEGYASTCVLGLKIDGFTTLIDGMDNRVEQEYSAWPNRLYLIGKDGRIAWKGEPGPPGYRPMELALAIEEELAK